MAETDTTRSLAGSARGFRWFLLLVMAAIIALLAVWASYWNMRNPSGGGPLRNDPQVVFDSALQELGQSGREPSDATFGQINEAARFAPLSAEPLFLHATRLLASGRKRRGMALLEQARHRDPRFLPARLLLLAIYFDGGKAVEAEDELATLSRFRPDANRQWVNLAVRLVKDQKTRKQALAALSSNPLRPKVLQSLARDGSSADFVLAMSQDLAGKAADDASFNWVAALVMPYVERGDQVSAFRLWSHFYGVDRKVLDEPPYDGDFVGKPGGAPFGWDLPSGSSGVAEIDEGAMHVVFFGRDRVDAARQLLLLPPGTYRLADKARLEEGDGGTLRWKIACAESGVSLFERPVAGPGIDDGTLFTVPVKSCPAQWLVLYAQPGPDIRPETLVIERVAIWRVKA